MKIITNCNFCNYKKFTFLYHSHDRIYNIDGKFSSYQCNRCKLIFTNPQPDNKTLIKHYPKNKYYSFIGEKPKKTKIFIYKHLFSKKRNLFIKLLLKPIRQFFRSTIILPNKKILDVGCGAGNFLLLMKQFKMKCWGIEPGNFNKAFSNKHQLNITKGTLKETNFPNNFFDIITINHVLEHVNNPSEDLKELYRILKPNGYLIIGVPQSNSLNHKIFKEYWVQLDIPRHLFTFSTKNIKIHSEKIGFKCKKIIYNSNPFGILASFLYVTNKFRKKPKFLSEKNFSNNTIIFRSLLPLTSLLNFLKIGDQVELILKK